MTQFFSFSAHGPKAVSMLVWGFGGVRRYPGNHCQRFNFSFQEAPAFTVIQAQSSARLSRSTHGGLGGGGGGGRYGSRSRLDGGSMGGGGGSRHGSQVDLSRSVQMTGEEDYIQPYEPQPQRAARVNSQTYRSFASY